ncbi:hypothetical protein Egran_04084, partial [Elaphomyces granulatus]
MTAPDIASLKSVNCSRPQLLHQQSQQSIAASDDYYSFSDSNKSSDSKVTVVRDAASQSHRPSQSSSPHQSRTSLDQEVQSSTDMQSSTRRPADTEEERVSPVTISTVRFGDNSVAEIRRQLDPSSPSPPTDVPENNSAPTPGVDDTPYIRFAIDQLTRDEEITGEGRQGSVVTTDYPVERLVGDEGLGYFTRQPKPTSATSAPATATTATTAKPATKT